MAVQQAPAQRQFASADASPTPDTELRPQLRPVRLPLYKRMPAAETADHVITIIYCARSSLPRNGKERVCAVQSE